MSAQPYVLPAIDPETAQQLDLIATRLPSGQFAFAGGTVRFKLAPLSGNPRKLTDPFQITLEWSGGQVHLIVSRAMLPMLYAHRFPQAQVDVLPEDLTLAALQLSLTELTTQLEQLGGRRVRLVRAGAADAKSLLPAPFRYSISLDSEVARDGVEGVVAADAAGLGLLALLARRQPAQPRPKDLSAPMPLRLEVGEMKIALSALRTLCVNDVLLPDSEIDAAAPTIRLRAGGRHSARARLKEDALVIESIFQEEHSMPSPSDKSAVPGSGSALAALDAIEVRLGFDLGDKTVTLGELAALQPGQVLTLDASLPRIVAIRANGSLIGRGELVQVADRVGVRVVELAAAEMYADATAA
jgi:type III secretion protein Q